MEPQQPIRGLAPPSLSHATARLRAVLAGEAKAVHGVENRSVQFADPPGLAKGSFTGGTGAERQEVTSYTHELLPGREFATARAVLDALEALT